MGIKLIHIIFSIKWVLHEPVQVADATTFIGRFTCLPWDGAFDVDYIVLEASGKILLRSRGVRKPSF